METRAANQGTEPAFRARSGRVVEAAGAAGLTAVVITLRPELPVLVVVACAFAASVLALDLARRESRAPSDVRPLACVIGGLLLVAVACPPHVPSDIRSYEADGLIVAHYHRNPYVVSPGAFTPDPAVARVRDAPAPYGPLFIGATAAVSAISHDGSPPERLWYQGSAALAIAGALVLLWRTRRSTASLVLLGLHPVVAAIVVNGGHNDAFIGLAVLAAVIVAEQRRFAGAGAIVALAMLVKVTAGLALIPIGVWAGARFGRPALVRFLAPIVIAVAPSLAIPGMFTAMRASNFALVTRTSVWSMDPFRAPLLRGLGDGAVTQLSLLAVGVAVLVVSSRRIPLGDRVAAAIGAWLVFSAYVMPWYTVWALPVAARDAARPLTRVIAWQGAVVVSAFLVPLSLLANHFVSFTFGWIAPAALVVGFVRAARSSLSEVG